MTFILRTIVHRKDEKYPTINNQILESTHYKVIKRNRMSSQEWHKVLKQYYPDMREEYIDLYVGLLIYSDAMPLEVDSDYYIMTESGATYEKIKFI